VPLVAGKDRRDARETKDALSLLPKPREDERMQDLRYGVRMLLKNPGLALVIVLLLALGIGVNTGVFTVLNGLMMRARVDKDPDSFIHLAPQYTGEFEQLGLDGALSLSDYRTFQRSAKSVSELAGWAIARVRLGDDAQSEMALLVTRNFFSVYGLERPKLGRLFLAEECARPNDAPVVILSEEIWRTRFDADPQIIGSTINLNRRPFTVIGVTPAHFSGRLRGRGIWIPYTMQPLFFGGRNLFQETSTQWLTVDGRIGPGQSHAAVQTEMSWLANQQDRFQPRRTTTMLLTNGSLIEEPSVRAKIFWVPWLVMGALSLVLLITCVNVTLLLLARASTRQKEMAIRLALGAGRQRLVRLLLTESLIVASAAGTISAWVAYQMPAIFERTYVEAPNYQLEPDWPVFAYLAGVTLLAGCLAGLAPALESLRVNLAATMNGSGGMPGGRKRHWAGRDLLIGAQVAMSVVLLVLAGLFVRAQHTMFNGDPGFETRHVLLAPLQAEPGRYTAESAVAFNRTLEQRIRALPGVQALCFAASPPGSGGGLDANVVEVRLPGQAKGTGPTSGLNIVSGEFFETFKIPIVAGRTFLETENSTSIIVSETFARRFWSNADPIGKVLEDANGALLQVVGVARDTRSGFGSLEQPQLYRRFDPQYVGSALMIRFAGDSRPVAQAVSNAIRTLDSGMLVTPQTLRARLDQQAERFWVIVRLILLLGLVAMAIAVVGIYGVVAFAVSRRRKEMGIRLALGANKGDIMSVVLRSGFKPIVAGLLAGLLLALAGSYALVQVLREMPIAVEVGDPWVYLSVAVILSLAALLALWGPAWRASNADPMLALRQD
jgi:putative ABC transport system permease protein